MNLNDAVSKMREIGTNGDNYDVYTEDIIKRLTKWSNEMEFEVIAVEFASVTLKFVSLPDNLAKFCKEVYEFCPDTIDQGYGCLADAIEIGNDVGPENLKLAEGLDLEDEDFGLKVMERDLKQRMELFLWWD